MFWIFKRKPIVRRLGPFTEEVDVRQQLVQFRTQSGAEHHILVKGIVYPSGDYRTAMGVLSDYLEPYYRDPSVNRFIVTDNDAMFKSSCIESYKVIEDMELLLTRTYYRYEI